MESPVGVGQVVAGKYEVERIVARGGGGIVVRAKHLGLLEPCAIKLMLPEAADKPHARERFLREARACARLKGDHVVKVFDVGELADGTPYIVLEYLDGVDLDDYMGGVPLPIDEAVGYVLPICAALAEAHGLGIVHRDVKPANVFLAELPDGSTRVKLLDFGVSKLLCAPEGPDQAETLVGALVGTPSFMAPEQVHSAQVDARTDIWGLGVLLYYLVTAHLPFRGSTPIATLRAVLEHDPVPPSTHLPSLPPGLSALILRCLQKDPEHRPGSVQEIAAAVAPFAFAAGDGHAPRSHGSHASAPLSLKGGPPSLAPRSQRARGALGSRSARRDPRWMLPAAIVGCVASATIAASFAPRSSEAHTASRIAGPRSTVVAPLTVPEPHADDRARSVAPPSGAPAASALHTSPPPTPPLSPAPPLPSAHTPSSLRAPGFEIGIRR